MFAHVTRQSLCFFHALFVLAAILAPSPGSATEPSELPRRFSAKGTISLLEAQLSAQVFYDSQDGYLRLDIAAQAETAHLVIDWSSARSGTYVFTSSRCHSSPVPVAGAPAVSEVKTVSSTDAMAAIEQQGDSLQLIRVAGVPHFVIESSPFLLVVRLDEVTAVQEIPKIDKVPQPCLHLEEWGAGYPLIRGEAPPAAAAEAWIQANGTFKSWSVDYVQPPFRSSETEYADRMKDCQKDPKCEDAYNVLAVRYGWHCGKDWGQGQSYWLDPTDAVCRYHDAKKWGSSDKENWCGMWSALYCWSESSWMAWRLKFNKSASAYVPIRSGVNFMAFFHGCHTPTCL